MRPVLSNLEEKYFFNISTLKKACNLPGFLPTFPPKLRRKSFLLPTFDVRTRHQKQKDLRVNRPTILEQLGSLSVQSRFFGS